MQIYTLLIKVKIILLILLIVKLLMKMNGIKLWMNLLKMRIYLIKI